MTPKQIPQPPHGAFGLDKTSDSSWLLLLVGGLVAIVLSAIVVAYWQRSSRKKSKAPTLEERIEVIQNAVNQLRPDPWLGHASFLATLSLQLRSALEYLTPLFLTDMTFQEIEAELPKHWPMTKPVQEFLSDLSQLDRGIYQDIELSESDLVNIRNKVLTWVQSFREFARLQR